MENKYSYEDFRMNEYAYKPIIENGRLSRSSWKYEINYSSILTRLIQEAGRFCENFASDLFIDWQGVMEYIDRAKSGKEKMFLFGFRQYGVDHDSYIFSRYESERQYAKHNYRSMWRLDVSTNGEDITMKLGRVF